MVSRENYYFAKAFSKYMRDTLQLDASSIARYWFYLRHLLLWADATSFSQASSIEPTFPSYLSSVRHGKNELLAPATLKKIVQIAKRLFGWLKMTYAREFRELPMSWIDALRPPRTIQQMHEHEFVTLDEALQLAAMNTKGDLALQRDVAGAAMLYISGMRAGALGSLPIEAVDLASRTIKQWPSLGVQTKNSKSATTYLLDIPQLFAKVQEWDAFIRAHLPSTAMWYTPIISQWGEKTLSADPAGANRNVAIVKRMRKLFAAAGLPYKSPHKFRHGHAVYALQHARTMADYKAISMNLMHADIRVTDGIYAPLVSEEVKQRIAGLTGQPTAHLSVDGDLAAFINSLSDAQLSQALIIAAGRLAQ